MRILLNVEMDTKKTNELIQSGRLGEVMQGILGGLKPEATYFYVRNGHRAFSAVVDAPDNATLPSLAEPMWLQLDAHVETLPCMTPEELTEGLGRLS
jgi:hypothetical protein